MEERERDSRSRIGLLGLVRLASPLAGRDVRARWRRSLERLRGLAERG